MDDKWTEIKEKWTYHGTNNLICYWFVCNSSFTKVKCASLQKAINITDPLDWRKRRFSFRPDVNDYDLYFRIELTVML